MSYTPLNSPLFTGNPQAPTASGGDNDTSIATTAFVQGELGAYLALAGGTMTGDITLSSGVDINFNDTSSGLQWSDVRIDRTAANVISLASGDFLRIQQDPSNANDVVRKSYVDAIASGLDWKASVQVASTGNLTLSGEQTIDGVLTSASRILVKDQTTGSENGIYVTAAGAWSRATDADEDAEVTAGLAVFVTEGTANSDKGFVLTTDDPIVVGTTALSFTQFTSTNITTLDSLTDVDTTGVVSHALLRYDGTNWVDTIDMLFNDTTNQLQLAGTGSGAGILIGGDAQWYRSAADEMRTPDALVVDGISTLTGAVTASAGVTATTGGFTATAGNIVATAGNIEATAGTLTVGSTSTLTGLATLTGGATTATGSYTTTSSGGFTASGTGAVSTNSGNISSTSGNLVISAGTATIGGKTTMSAGQRVATTTKTANYSVNLATDYAVLVDNTADTVDITITLPASHSAGDTVVVKDVGGNAQSGTNQILIATSDADTIDGSASDFELTVDYQSVTLVSDGTNWFLV